MIGFQNVSFSYGEKNIISNLSFNAERGRALCIQGQSGAGKSTILRLLCGLEKPDKGEISMPEKISVMFQDDRLLPFFNLRKNITYFTGCSKEEVNEMLDKVGLFDMRESRISSLSGGMKRRAAFVRAVLFCGDALILDEPFNGIDDDNKKIMADIVKEKFLNQNKYVIMVSHNPQDAELLRADILNIYRKARD